MARSPQAARDPLGHYCRRGWRDGLDPGPWFSTAGYLDAHPDVARAGTNPLLHFITSGQQEGRWPAGTKPDEHDRFPRAIAPERAGKETPDRAIVFLVDLVQDVGVLRPLVLMATGYDLPIIILVSGRFAFLDGDGAWQDEIAALADETGATVLIFGTADEAAAVLPPHGLMFSASESSAPAHALNHAVFTVAPARLHKVTVQHGFECLGFRHNREHDRAHGEVIRFAADTVCAWYDRPALTAFVPDASTRLLVTGPPSLLDPPMRGALAQGPGTPLPGLVSENLHSVRYVADDRLVEEFLRALSRLAASEDGHSIALRPHPAGAFVANQQGRLPGNVRPRPGPLWKIGLPDHAYAICSPSSFAIDAMLAGLPTAIWQDRGGTVDTAAFDGLPKVSSPDEWIAFAHRARKRPQDFAGAQDRWLRALGFVTDPAVVRDRFAGLFATHAGRRHGP
ncbi:hypothetical protein [Croceibacterium ferulae]|uniref:hypothetical protein n=1 Tax=Croceibacterium ferulae TaxID=1854641 RepID=UPI000EABADDD|nr:hypothetical protein [Croceibacterium ferulae]